MAALDAALLSTERHLSRKDAAIFADGKLRFPKEPRGDNEQEQTRTVTARLYSMMTRVRITDMLDQVNHWTNLTEHFSHLSPGLPPVDHRPLVWKSTVVGKGGIVRVETVGGGNIKKKN